MRKLVFVFLFVCTLKNLAVADSEMPLRQVEVAIEPFAFYRDEQMDGIFYHLGKLLAKRLNKKHDFVIVPWNRANKSMASGLADIEISPAFIVEDQRKLRIDPAIGRLDFSFYTYSKHHQQTDRLIVAVPKSAISHFAEELGEWVDTLGYEGFADAMLLLKNNNVDGIVINTIAFKVLAKRHGFNLDHLQQHWTKTFPVYLWVSKNSELATSRHIEPLVKQIHDEDLLSRIIDTCLGKYIVDAICHYSAQPR